MANFEGQDFDMVENDVERRVNLERDHLDYIAEDSWRWAIACEPHAPHEPQSPVNTHLLSQHIAFVMFWASGSGIGFPKKQCKQVG